MKRHFLLGRAEIWLLAIFRCFFDAFSPHFKKSPKLFSNNKISNQGSKHIVKGWNLNVQRKHLDQIQKFARYSHFNLGDFCDFTFINKKFLKSQSVASKTLTEIIFQCGFWWIFSIYINGSWSHYIRLGPRIKRERRKARWSKRLKWPYWHAGLE